MIFFFFKSELESKSIYGQCFLPEGYTFEVLPSLTIL